MSVRTPVGSRRRCPGCGSRRLLPSGEALSRHVCERCGRCWEDGAGGSASEVDILTCDGCPQRTVCESRPTWLAEASTRTVVLRDGTRVLLRPLLYSDRQELAFGYQRLSREGRRLRFFSAPAELTRDDLDYLTNIDYDRHFAWAARAIDQPGCPGIGVARFVRDQGRPQEAEVAITVLDAYQGLGLGTLLLFQLADTAAAKGIKTFVSHVLWENESVLTPLLEAGARVLPEEPGVARVEIDVVAPDRVQQEGLLHRVLRTVAVQLGLGRD